MYFGICHLSTEHLVGTRRKEAKKDTTVYDFEFDLVQLLKNQLEGTNGMKEEIKR